MSQKPRLFLGVESREGSRARFLSSMKGRHHIETSLVPYDPGRLPSEERVLRSMAVSHAREMLALRGFTLTSHDEVLAERFISGAIDEAELAGERA